MLKRLVSTLLLTALFSTSTFAAYSFEDISKIKNDKESFSRVLSKKKIKKVKAKYEKLDLKVKDIFYTTLQSFLNSEATLKCELTFLKNFKKGLRLAHFKDNNDSVEELLALLRANNHIDDILYKLMSDVNVDYHKLRSLNFKKKIRLGINKNKKLVKNNNLKELYKNFSKWPNGSTNCVSNEFVWLKNNIKSKKDKALTPEEVERGDVAITTGSKRDLKKLNRAAYRNKLISSRTYRKLQYLTSKSKLDKKSLWLTKYVDIVSNAKNRLNPISYNYEIKDISQEDEYTQDRLGRLKKLTRREILYRKYNQTEIIILAQILQRASQRMGVDPDTESSIPVISQSFSVLLADGTRNNYVEELELDTQDQYNLARKRLSRDITEIQMMGTFSNKEITYDDIVVAAFETGYISFEDIEFVILYDDLWNPSQTKFEKVMGFAFTVAGYSSFYIPPPWNAVVSIALGVVQGLILNRNIKGSENDNTASLIN
jgi:hypothetical protein